MSHNFDISYSPAEHLYYSIWKTIFSFLEPGDKDLLSCRRTCKTLKKYADKYLNEVIFTGRGTLRQKFVLHNTRFASLQEEDQINIMNIISTIYHSQEILNKANGYELLIASQFIFNLPPNIVQGLKIFITLISDQAENQMDSSAWIYNCREIFSNIGLHKKIISTFTLEQMTPEKLQLIESLGEYHAQEGFIRFRVLELLIRWTFTMKDCAYKRLKLNKNSQEVLDQMDIEIGRESKNLRKFINRRDFFSGLRNENNLKDNLFE